MTPFKHSLLALALTVLLGTPLTAMAQQYILPEEVLSQQQSVQLPPSPRDAAARAREQFMLTNTYKQQQELLRQQALAAMNSSSSSSSSMQSVSSLHGAATSQERQRLRLFLREEAARRANQGSPLSRTGPETSIALVVLVLAAASTLYRARAQRALPHR